MLKKKGMSLLSATMLSIVPLFSPVSQPIPTEIVTPLFETRYEEEYEINDDQELLKEDILIEILRELEEQPLQTAIKKSEKQAIPIPEKLYSIDEFERLGVIKFKGIKLTYYSQRVLPGGGLKIPGRHVKDGFVRDEKGYIVAAAGNEKYRGKVFTTPFGAYAKIYDFCVG